MSESKNPLEQLFKSSTLCACQQCGSTATYYGTPEEINAAAQEFYELHERCWKRDESQRKER